jgi:hypothetical protein
MEYLRCKCTQAAQCFIPGKIRAHGKHSKATITNKTRPAGSFFFLQVARQAALPARCSKYVYVFSLVLPLLREVGRGGGGRNTAPGLSHTGWIYPMAQKLRRNVVFCYGCSVGMSKGDWHREKFFIKNLSACGSR